jgi:hypothetical protein
MAHNGHSQATAAPRSLDELRQAVEELRAQLHWVRDYL